MPGVLLRPGDDERKTHGPGRCERRLRVLSRVNGSDEEHVAAVGGPGRERRVDAVARDGHLRLRHAVAPDDVPLRALRHGDHVVGAADGPRYDGPKREAIEKAHRAVAFLERQIVHGDD